jgi:hypothetical protein
VKYLALLGVVFCLSCGGDDPDPAVAKCKDLVAALCERFIDCRYGHLPDRPQLLRECREWTLANNISCDKATDVGPGYDQCLSELPTSSCDGWNSTPQRGPASCVGAIKI